MTKNEIISNLNEKITQIKVTETDLWLLNTLYSAIDELNVVSKALDYACTELSLYNKLEKRKNAENLLKVAKRAMENV